MQPDCHGLYGVFSDDPTTTTVLCTIGIIALTLALEIIVHARFGSSGTKKATDEEQARDLLADTPTSLASTSLVSEQPQPVGSLQAQPQDRDGQKDTKTAEDGSYCSPTPSSHTRATRFAFAVIVYSAILILFITRMNEATNPFHEHPECAARVDLPPPNYVVIAFLNVIPLICATSAFLRTLIDCLLARWGSGLRYEIGGKKGWLWTPFMPLFSIGIVAYLALECVKIPVALAMGDREVSMWTASNIWGSESGVRNEEVEMHGEETLGLVENVDGGDGSVVDGPPAYDEVVVSNTSVSKGGK
jgi:hypothetical protein